MSGDWKTCGLVQIDALLELELDKFGYTFLTIDDYWQLPERDLDTMRMVADPIRSEADIQSVWIKKQKLGFQMASNSCLTTCTAGASALASTAALADTLAPVKIKYQEYTL